MQKTETDEIFDFIILSAELFFYINVKRKMNARFLMYLKNNWQQGIKTEETLSYVNMENASFRSKWLCYMFFVQNHG